MRTFFLCNIYNFISFAYREIYRFTGTFHKLRNKWFGNITKSRLCTGSQKKKSSPRQNRLVSGSCSRKRSSFNVCISPDAVLLCNPVILLISVNPSFFFSLKHRRMAAALEIDWIEPPFGLFCSVGIISTSYLIIYFLMFCITKSISIITHELMEHKENIVIFRIL